jgi:erythromycin esterase-like protein
MPGQNIEQVVAAIRSVALPLSTRPAAAEYRKLVDHLRQRDFILLGEATHGTAEFYQARIDITKQLIAEQGIAAIAIEGDWPSAYRVNRYVRGQGVDGTAVESLGDFTRFPLWMWRNTVVLDFVEWLRNHNQQVPRERQVGFYGLDMYSMYESIAAILEYLDQVDPETAQYARKVYACLDHVDGPQTYGYGVSLGHRPSCEREVVRLLTAMRGRARVYVGPDDAAAEEDLFEAEQNARLVKSAEHYYRQMFDGHTNTWNLRDSHMADTLFDLQAFLSRRTRAAARIVVWAHNSHIGDARATYMSDADEHNLGQLVREKSSACALIGFTTYTGTVTAASAWEAAAECKRVRPGLPGSLETVLHDTDMAAFMLPLQQELSAVLQKPLLQRAIGVLYLPGSERSSHYFPARVERQFDWVIHMDRTSALEPLDAVSEWQKGEAQTYPFGV